MPDALCRTVVLDTENLRGAPAPVLALLRARGLRLHVSNVALEELWAQAARENKPGLLLGRVRRIAEFIDVKEPVKTSGVDLVRRIGGSVRDPLIGRPDGRDPAALAILWNRLVRGEVSEAFIVESAKEIESNSARAGASWVETIRAAATLKEWNSTAMPASEIVRKVAHAFFETFGRSISVPGGMHERFHGYYYAAALHAVQSRQRTTGELRKVDENDNEDLQILMHLGECAFVATYDLNLIEHVDATGSFQAPWVRTIGELLTLDLPLGRPWGSSARKMRRAHAPRSRDALREREERVRASARE